MGGTLLTPMIFEDNWIRLCLIIRDNDRESWAAIVQPEIDNTFGTSGQKWWKDVEDKKRKVKAKREKKLTNSFLSWIIDSARENAFTDITSCFKIWCKKWHFEAGVSNLNCVPRIAKHSLTINLKIIFFLVWLAPFGCLYYFRSFSAIKWSILSI